MRSPILISAALVGLVLAGCSKPANDETAAPAAPAEAPAAKTKSDPLPHRRPGLWEQRVSMGDFVQASRICIDPSVDQKVSWWGQQSTRDVCEKNLINRKIDGTWAFASVCDMGSGGKTTTAGVASGDFNSRYLIQAESSTVGAEAPQMNGTRKMTIEAAWQGACPSDFKPGDMEIAGGTRINLLDMGR